MQGSERRKFSYVKLTTNKANDSTIESLAFRDVIEQFEPVPRSVMHNPVANTLLYSFSKSYLTYFFHT